MKKKLFIFVSMLSVIFIIAQAENTFAIIELKHRMAQELLPVIRPLVGDNGVVTAANNQLFIRTDNERMAEIQRVVDTLDVERYNHKISVSYDAVNTQQQNNVGVQGTINQKISKHGNVIISNSRRLPDNSAQIQFEQNNTRISQQSSQFVNVIDGERAFIKSEQMVPYTQEWLLLKQRYIQVQKIINFKDITTGFAVRLSSIGGSDSDEFELEITPRIASLNNSGFIDFEALSTTVRVRKGEWFDLGGTMVSKDEVSRKILSAQNQTGQETNNLKLRVDN